MTDTAAHADVVLPATTQLEHLDVVFSWGHHYVTWNEPAIEPRGEAKAVTETFRLLAARLGLDDPCFADSDEQLMAQLLEGTGMDGLRERGWRKVDLGQGPTPHAEGGFGTATGKVALHADYRPPAEVADARARRALPARADHAEDAPLPQLDVRQPAAPARGPAASRGGGEPGRRGRARGRGRRRVRVFNERGDFRCVARVSEDARPGVLVAPMGWWNRDYADGRSPQATTSQLLTAENPPAPTFNDNRVGARSRPSAAAP